MTLHSEAAGSFGFYECPNCNGVVKIFSRSFAGNGKKCPHCYIIFYPSQNHPLVEVEVYEFRKSCPVCKKKLLKVNVLDPQSARYCQFRKSHPKD